MHIHYENWTQPLFLETLNTKGFPHVGEIYKVFASADDPRNIPGMEGLHVVPGDGTPFDEEFRFDFADRGLVSGSHMEIDLALLGLEPRLVDRARALVRWSYDTGYLQGAMATTRGARWLIDKPTEVIDGVEGANQRGDKMPSLHLDVFYPESVELLRSMVDVDNPILVPDAMVMIRAQRRGAAQAQTTPILTD